MTLFRENPASTGSTIILCREEGALKVRLSMSLQPEDGSRETWLYGDPLIGRDRLDDMLVMQAAANRR